MDLCCVTVLQIICQIAQIEHFSYAYFRVLFLECDGRRRNDPNGRPTWENIHCDLLNGVENTITVSSKWGGE